MSQKENHENLLIDFNNLNVSAKLSNETCTEKATKPVEFEDNSELAKMKSRSMAFLCSSEPLYKLLGSEPNDVDNNNPFDHLDKQACLSDDPFEIVENAALISSDIEGEPELLNVEMGTLILFESPIVVKSETGAKSTFRNLCETTKTPCTTQSQDSIQLQMLDSKNVSPKPLASPIGKNRCKLKNTSLNLLKYSISNNCMDVAAESVSHNEENVSADETQQKKQKLGPLIRRESSTDDSFDDIWATKPNLIDSQTDIDIDNDVDNDIAKLNIPMLNISTSELKSEDNLISYRDGQVVAEESNEARLINRNEILEKLAVIKQKNPQSPLQINEPITPIHSQMLDISCDQPSNTEMEPATPKSQYSSVLLPEHITSDNPNSLIENLKKLVDQCDDKSKQTTAKHLLENLSSILSTNNDKSTKINAKSTPKPIQRQGTFSLEGNISDVPKECSIPNENSSVDSLKSETSPIDHCPPGVMEQIQNVLGSHQNINMLPTNVQTMEMSTASTINPTYIVFMAQPIANFDEKVEYQKSQRVRSQSLTLKERPLAALRATQHKIEQSSVPPSLISTPIKRPVLQRRSSFGTITRATTNNESGVQSNPCVKPDVATKVIRRRSLQSQSENKPIEPEPTQIKHLNPVTRRRSFQGTSTVNGIRSPSPKANSAMNRIPPLRLNCNTAGTLTRRKSFANGVTKESPQKIKTSYGIMKKPLPPPATRNLSNLRIRVSQSGSGRSTVPMRAIVPMNRVASLQLVNESVSPVDDNKDNALITSTPRSIPPSSPAKFKGSIARPSALPVESPIQNVSKNTTYLSLTPSKSTNKELNRRRTLSEYRSEVNSSVTVDPNLGGKTVSTIKNATKTLASGISKFTSRRMSSIGLKRPSSMDSKENKKP